MLSEHIENHRVSVDQNCFTLLMNFHHWEENAKVARRDEVLFLMMFALLGTALFLVSAVQSC